MACRKCNTIPCGCKDGPLTTIPLYQDSTTCPQPQICSEYTYTGCIIYNGPELTEVNIVPGMNMNEVIQALVLLNTNPACITTDCPAVFVNVIKITGTTIDIGWNQLSEAISYTVSYVEESASPGVWTDLAAVLPPTSHLIITGLDCATTYIIKVNTEYSDHTCDSVIIRVTTSAC